MRMPSLALTAMTMSLMAATLAPARQPPHRPFAAVPPNAVEFQVDFWAIRIRTNHELSLPHNFEQCEKTGRIANFAKAAGLAKGKHEGAYYNDSDVYKVLQGASDALAIRPDPALEKKVDEVIAKIAAAQQPDGYLNTYYTLVEPGKRWTNCQVRHELYCAGHLIEAAIAHHRATGKRTLLDVAVKLANHVDSVFGPGKKIDVPGHQEIELALVRLYELTGDKRYFNLAEFFLNGRGDHSQRKDYGPSLQDHLPIRQQREIVGHCVRAMYMMCGALDVAAYTGDAGFLETADRLWEDMVLRKMYVTGGIGAWHDGEAFGRRDELPNASSYAETCAAIGTILWSHRLNLMYGDAKYANIIERALYNAFLAGVSMDGKNYFYVNPLESPGNRHRQPFYTCACCPTNVVRVFPVLGSYVYACSGDRINVNLYAASKSRIPLDKGAVTLTQKTRYPWDGKIAILVEPEQPTELEIGLRIPDWCQGARLTVNGEAMAKPVVEKGYTLLRRTWTPGDTIELELPMPIRRIEAHPRVAADVGRVAVQRGPIVYCFEGVDNGGRGANLVLPRDPEFVAERRDDLLGGLTVIRGVDMAGRPIMAVPYYAWDHRAAGPMAVWVLQDGKSRDVDPDDPTWRRKLYRTLDPAMLGPSTPVPSAEVATPSASFCCPTDTPGIGEFRGRGIPGTGNSGGREFRGEFRGHNTSYDTLRSFDGRGIPAGNSGNTIQVMTLCVVSTDARLSVVGGCVPSSPPDGPGRLHCRVAGPCGRVLAGPEGPLRERHCGERPASRRPSPVAARRSPAGRRGPTGALGHCSTANGTKFDCGGWQKS